MTQLYRYAAVGLVTCALLGSALFFYSSNRAPDDAYISLRYARNLAAGEGLRFNPGGERVEGFSSPLHVLAMGAAISLGAPPLAVSQFSSLFGAAIGVALITWWGQRRLGFWWGTCAGLAVALNPSLGTWARGGLETTIFMTLVALTLIAAAEQKWKTMGVLAGLLAVTRPEGPLYWLALVAFVLLAHRDGLAAFRVPALLMVGTWLPWFLFRVLYFGDILPNTYYAKMDGVRAAQIQRGSVYLEKFLARSEITVPLVLIGVALVALWLTRRSRTAPLARWPVAAAGSVGASFVFTLLAGGDHMNHFRFLVPAIPPLMVLAAWSATRLIGMVPGGRWRLVVGLGLGFAFLSQPLRMASHDLRYPNFPLDRPVGLVEPLSAWHIPRFYRLGLKLKEKLPPAASIALVPAGALPYASGLTTIDMLGLNDREVARQSVAAMGTGRMGHEKGRGEPVLARRPDIIMLRSRINDAPGAASAPASEDLSYRPVRDIWESAAFHADYEPFVMAIDDTTSYTLYRRRAAAP